MGDKARSGRKEVLHDFISTKASIQETDIGKTSIVTSETKQTKTPGRHSKEEKRVKEKALNSKKQKKTGGKPGYCRKRGKSRS